VGGHWQIGTVQRWWLRFEKLGLSHEPLFFGEEGPDSPADKLVDEFPMCGVSENMAKWEKFKRDRWLRDCGSTLTPAGGTQLPPAG